MESETHDTQRGAGRPGPILIVDDDLAILETMAAILDDEGYPVATARNGLEGLEAVERERPALVLLDRWMPVMDGEGFWRALGRRNLSVPIVAMTAAHDGASWARDLKAAAVLHKPFKIEALLEVVAEALGGERDRE